jgi:hypothetical protein
MLDLDSCAVDAIHRDLDPGHSDILAQTDVSSLDEMAVSLPDHHRKELPIVVWAAGLCSMWS